MGISVIVSMVPMAVISPGITLCYGEATATGDGSGGNCDLVFKVPAQDVGPYKFTDWWFPLWGDYEGIVSGTPQVERRSQFAITTGSKRNASIIINTDALGKIAQATWVGFIHFLRTPHFPRDDAAGQSLIGFIDSNTNLVNYDAQLWALRIQPSEADMVSALQLMLAAS